MLFLVELCEHLDAELMVGSASCLAAAVHGKDGISHVDTAQRNGRGKDVAQCASTCHITVVHKALSRHTCLLAQAGKDRCRISIAGILLGSIKLDDRSASQHRMVGRVVLLGVVGMPCMGIVCRNHEGTLHSLIISLLGSALSQGDALEHVGEERTSGSLLGLRARLLVVEDGKHLCGVGGL